MNKKWLLITILGFTGIIVTVLLVFNNNKVYDKLVVDTNEWNNIINTRTNNSLLSLDNIKFNDYSLVIDKKNSILYYSVVDSSKKYNPVVNYIANSKVKIVINQKIDDNVTEKDGILKVMIYDKNSYHIYDLMVTNYPILNIKYMENNTGKRIDVELNLFDNHVDAINRVIKSDGKFMIVKENEEYIFSLTKESLGNNQRDNNISIFGMNKHDQYTLKRIDNVSNKDRYVKLFINDEYVGIYTLNHRGERRINRNDGNK